LRRLARRSRKKNPFEPPTARTKQFTLPRLAPEWRGTGQKSFIVLGNCQSRPLASSLQALCPSATFTPVELTAAAMERFAAGDKRILRSLCEYDAIFAQVPAIVTRTFPDLTAKVVRIPFVTFAAYHPDLVYINTVREGAKQYLFGPMGQYHSAITLWAYLHGKSTAETLTLFNAATYEALGYFDFWQTSRNGVLHEGEAAGMLLHANIDRWARRGCFMHSVNHPKIDVFIDIAQELLRKLELPCLPNAAQYLIDEFAEGAVWPIYPEIGQNLGIDGDYYFKIEKRRAPPGRPVVLLDLRNFIELSFETFSSYDRDQLSCERLQSGRFERLTSPEFQRSATTEEASPRTFRKRHTPYADLPSHQFWKGSVAMVPRHEVDPVVRAPFKVSRRTAIATAGSCFAQHIAATLQRYGFNYYVSEAGEGLAPEDVRRDQYGVYSARYGNLYTARQLLQLFLRAYGHFIPADIAWQRSDGRFVDPFRPLIDPAGWESPDVVGLVRLGHYTKVREMFENLEVLIFTLGLTETWRSKLDGAVFPLAPGVAAEVVDPSQYEFVNFRVAEVVADLQLFLEKLRAVNPTARMILTVSPVPLLATYEPQHALVATTYSKSVLRAAAAEVCARNENCAYFPSYEVITGNYARGAYYEADLRTVTAAGIEHVMGLFLKHYTDEQGAASVDPALMKELDSIREIVCDERAIES
jgi:hypothetical protein